MNTLNKMLIVLTSNILIFLAKTRFMCVDMYTVSSTEQIKSSSCKISYIVRVYFIKKQKAKYNYICICTSGNRARYSKKGTKLLTLDWWQIEDIFFFFLYMPISF